MQRGVHLVVPFGADHAVAAVVAVPDRQLRRHRVLAALVAGREGDASAVGAVARAAEVPFGVAHDDRGLAALQFHLCLLYTSDAADERSRGDLGGRRLLKKKKHRHATKQLDNKHQED